MIMHLRELLKSKLFLAILALKTAFLFFGAGEVPQQLFLPFLDRAVQAFGANPWTLSSVEHFPYGAFLFAILFLPKWLLFQVFGPIALGTEPLSVFALKTPLLVFDLLFFLTLCLMAPTRRRDLTLLYWANPVLFYINSIHGQLDVVSMSLCALSLWFLIRDRVAMSALVFALATASKFHVVAAIPFLLVFIWHKEFRLEAWRLLSTWLGVWFAVTVAGFLPLWMSGAFGGASLQSPELARLFAAQIALGSSHVFYLGLFGTLLVLGRLVISTDISDLGLVLGVGTLFSALVFFSDSAPGWYYWSVPFLALFFALYLNAPRILMVSLSAGYLLFFGWNDFYPASANSPATSLLFTFLQTSLLACLGVVWVAALRTEAKIFNRLKPLRIGVAGDSGAGKNTLTAALQALFGYERVTVVEGDNYHKWERGDANWSRLTHLDPRANDVISMSRHASALSEGRPVLFSEYSHQSGRFQSPRELRPSRTLVVQGLHTFFLRGMRDHFDLKIYLDPAPLLRRAWKVRRDVGARGADRTKVLRDLESRAADSEAYIRSQRVHADLIVEFGPASSFSESQADAGEMPPLSLSVTLWNDVDLEPLLRACSNVGLETAVTLPVDPDRVTVVFPGEPGRAEIEKIASSLFPNPRRLTRGVSPPRWQSGHLGLLQVLILSGLPQRAESRP